MVSGYPFDPKVKPGTRVFQRATPLPPVQREWVRQEVNKMEQMGILRKVFTCDSACGVVLIEKGQQGQEYPLCCNFVELNAHTGKTDYPV